MSLKLAKWLLVSLAVLIVGAVLATRLVYPFIETAAYSYEVLGVDVSHHQGAIDWDRLARDDVDFAFIKATEGGNFNDPRFSRNWYAAEQAGVLRGAYHFFTQCRPGKVQARNFIRVVPKDANALPPVVDAEHMGPCRQNPRVKDVAAELELFIGMVRAHYGKRPIIYTTREFHDAYLTGRFQDHPFWVRSLILAPRFREQGWVFWQYHNRGWRGGVSGPVDLNAFRGTLAELKALR